MSTSYRAEELALQWGPETVLLVLSMGICLGNLIDNLQEVKPTM
jgi:hypothetical protein